MKKFLIPLLLMLPCMTFAQSDITDDIIIDQIERMMENSDEELDFTELIEEYWTICENKININNPEELNQLIDLHLVNAITIENINAYRKNYGDFMMPDELQFVEGIDEMTLNIIKPLICFDKPKEKEKLRAKDLWKYGKHQTIFQMERCFNKKAGYLDVSDSILAQNPNKKYLGSPNKILFRYSFTSSKKLEYGFAMEKDAGEKNMLDFVSFHFLINDWKFVKTLALGDYQLGFGQGVTMGSGLAFAAGGGSLLRKTKKIRASKSANEVRYLRGAATTLNYKNFDLTIFYSNKKADANVSVLDSTTGEPLVVTALQQTGLHRTEAELADRHAVTQQLFGGNLSYRSSRFQIGYTIHKTILSCELNPDPRLYNTFYFRGKTLANQGVDFYYVLKKIAFYGEAAISDNLAPAALIGATVQPAGYIDFSVLYRYYDKKYQNFYSNAFASGNPRNEKGPYLSTSITFAPRWRLIATADFPQSDWIKTTAYAPSRTQDYNLQIEHQINGNSLFFIQLRYKDKEKNGPSDNTYMRALIHDRKMSLRFHVTYPVGNDFIFKNRVELINYKDLQKNGRCYLIYQDILYKPDSHPFSFAFRYMLFDSPVGAVYAYENDILNSFAIGSFYHKGMRIYLLGKVKLRWGLSINAKIGCTIYSDVNEIGSGLEKIEGNVKTEGKIQMIWKL